MTAPVATTGPRPVVYLGPSLPLEDARAILPGALFREPVRRGDLYRDRHAGESFFVMIDGLFQNELAISPRETIDVLQDGARVLGASSMGALRAAECWPAGMQGVGVIYRMFRQRRLHSDDEVAVICHPGDAYRSLTVALVDVRWALRQAERAGMISTSQAANAVRLAAEMFYEERSWPLIFRAAGISDPQPLAFCRGMSLKRNDGLRALRKAAQMRPENRRTVSQAAVARRIASYGQGVPRERSYDAAAGRRPEDMQAALFDWLAGSGAIVTHLLPFVAMYVDLLPRADMLRDWLIRALGEQAMPPWRRPPEYGLEILEALLMERAKVARLLWDYLTHTGALHAELMREAAVAAAARTAASLHLTAGETDRYLAEQEIALSYGYPSFPLLRSTAEAPLGALLDAACRARATAKRVRAYLFGPGAAEVGGGPFPPDCRAV